MAQQAERARSGCPDLNKLRVFAVVPEHENFTRAAEELLISQPALSVHVRDLEQYYGVPLFEKSGRGVRLTEVGRLVHWYARKILALAAESEEAVDDLQGLRSGHLRLGASTTVGEYLLSPILGAFRREYPGVRVSLQIANSAHIEDRLRHGEVHMGLIGKPVSDPDLETEPFLEDHILLIVPPEHPWAGAEVSPEELCGEMLVSREPGSATRDVTDRALAELGVAMEVTLELGQTEAVKGAVAAGLGVAFVSSCAVRQEVVLDRVAVARVHGLNIARQFYLVRREDRRLTAAERAFIPVLHRETPNLVSLTS